MFHPVDHPMERGWVGRIDGDRVVHLAAQTLQSFFTGGGSAREHAEYPLADVCLLAPVLHPPSVRIFDGQERFEFANPAAIVGPRAAVAAGGGVLVLLVRLAAVIGADTTIGGYTVMADWRREGASPPKDRDFALGVGPVLVTAAGLRPEGIEAAVAVDREERLRGRFAGFDWEAARDRAEAGTVLRPGDLMAGPSLGPVDGLRVGSSVEIDVAGVGLLSQRVAT